MAVKKDASGRRSVSVETEVPGTPEEVWQVIATGPGITSWFVPTELDGRVGGTMTLHFGPGFDATAAITAWDPPRRLVGENPHGPGAPTMATEWVVEPRAGGRCVVRVVHSLFAATDEWDDQLTGTETGWPAFFVVLRRYLEQFRGQSCHPVLVVGMSPDPAAWDKLAAELKLTGMTVGRKWVAPAGVPTTAGTVIHAVAEKPGQIVALDTPVPGTALLSACPMGGMTVITIVLYLYGPAAAGRAAGLTTEWQNWLNGLLPAT